METKTPSKTEIALATLVKEQDQLIKTLLEAQKQWTECAEKQDKSTTLLIAKIDEVAKNIIIIRDVVLSQKKNTKLKTALLTLLPNVA